MAPIAVPRLKSASLLLNNSDVIAGDGQLLVRWCSRRQPRRSTIVRGASLTALLAFATILAVTIRLPTGGGSEAATALLLAASGIIGLFIVRGGEDQMATTLLFPLRLLAVMPVVLSVGAATVVVMHLGEFASRILLIGISLLTAIATGFLLRNWYLVRKVQDV